MIKTVSLETAKMLKKAGWIKETQKYHVNKIDDRGRDNWEVMDLYCFPRDVGYPYYSAPTTDELLEELPYKIDDTHRLEIYHGIKNYGVAYYNGMLRHGKVIFQNESLSEALAQMWLWLKKEGLIGGEKCQ